MEKYPYLNHSNDPSNSHENTRIKRFGIECFDTFDHECIAFLGHLQILWPRLWVRESPCFRYFVWVWQTVNSLTCQKNWQVLAGRIRPIIAYSRSIVYSLAIIYRSNEKTSYRYIFFVLGLPHFWHVTCDWVTLYTPLIWNSPPRTVRVRWLPDPYAIPKSWNLFQLWPIGYAEWL